MVLSKGLVIAGMVLIAPVLHGAELLTMNEALDSAVKNHPVVAEAKASVQGNEARLGLARSAWYPQINISGDWSRGDAYLTATGGIRMVEVTSATVNLRQTIYDFGRTAGMVRAARGNLEAATHAASATRSDVILRVKAAYYLVLAAEQQVVAARATVAIREDLFRQASEFFVEGVRSKVDVAKAEAAFFAARSVLLRAENNLDLARAELANAMGVASCSERPLSNVPAVELPSGELAELQREAYGQRAELKRLSAMRVAAEGNVLAARSSYLPILSGTAGCGYTSRDFPPDGKVWTVGINLIMPLFSGFSSGAQVGDATAGLSTVEAQLENSRLQIGKEVEAAWLDEKDAAARISTTAKELVAARESQALAMERYREGIGTLLEATDAQVQALNADTAHIQAEYDRNVAVARLERALGRQ